MQNNVAPDGGDIPISRDNLGSLYRISSDGHPRTFKDNIGISNTFCWSPDRTLFYTADTLRNQITVWDYDQRHGRIANERPFFFDFKRGKPDGSAVDTSGHVWNARYGGGCVVRLTPTGQVDRVVEMPVGNITNCTFGGADLKTLYITTAQGGSGAGERLAGSLYALAVDVPGVPAHKFRLSGNS
jgi:sugar lactone lactonase YvrE